MCISAQCARKNSNTELIFCFDIIEIRATRRYDSTTMAYSYVVIDLHQNVIQTTFYSCEEEWNSNC